MRLQALLATLTCFLLSAWACDQREYHNGCKIKGADCDCNWGCMDEFIYKTRRECRIALKEAVKAKAPEPERSSDICSRAPCSRGICIQTTTDIGFTCKCEGTGFYGQRCEKACPTYPVIGQVFPHECVVI